MLKFVLLSFAGSWSIWLAASVLAPAYAELAFLPGTIMPAIVALWLTKRNGGNESLRRLIARVFAWRVSIKYFLFALTFMAAVRLAAASLYRLGEGEWPTFGTIAPVVMLIAILVSTPVQAGEEVGWRGYMLPWLAERMGFASASIIVGVVWAAWHLPMFFIQGGDMVGQSFLMFVLMVTALSVAMSWLYVRTGGSLLLTMLMHASINNTASIVPSRMEPDAGHVFSLVASPMAWLTALVLWAVAAVLLVSLRRTDLGQKRSDAPEAIETSKRASPPSR